MQFVAAVALGLPRSSVLSGLWASRPHLYSTPSCLQAFSPNVFSMPPCSEQELAEGSIIKVIHSFESNDKINKVMLPIGERGKVEKIDKDGDALIAFFAYSFGNRLNWVFQQNFLNLDVEERNHAKRSAHPSALKHSTRKSAATHT